MDDLINISEKKYEILDDQCININGHYLYRIRAVKDFYTIRDQHISPGDIGGYISSEDCLSQTGKSWIDKNVKVFSGGKVCDNSLVEGNVCVKDYVYICGASFIASFSNPIHLHIGKFENVSITV